MLSFFSIFLRHKKTVILVTAGGFVFSAAASLVIPPRYISSASFIPTGVEKELTGSGGFFSNLGSLGDTYSSLIRVRNNLVIDYIIRSRHMSGLMAERFGLEEVYGVSNLDDARNKLRERTNVIVRDEGVIVVGVEDRDPVRARDMVAAYVEFMDSMMTDLSVRNMREKHLFLERESVSRKAKVAMADSAISRFMARHGLFEMQSQAFAALGVISGLGARQSMLEMEKELLEMSMTRENLRVERLDLELLKIREKMDRLITGEGLETIFPPLKEMPGLASEYLALAGEKMIQEFALAFVQVKLADAAMVSTMRTGTIRVIDPPFVPEIRAWPKRKQIVMVFTAASFFWACFAILLREQIREGRFGSGADEDLGGVPAGAPRKPAGPAEKSRR